MIYPAYPQKFMPIVFLLHGGGIPVPVPFGIPEIGLVRPEHVSIVRRTRGHVQHTAKAAVLDDYGEGTGQLILQGNTGWRGSLISGLTGFKLLELLLVEYERRRQRLADSGRDPSVVKLWYLDALNVEAFEIYLHEALFEKDRQRPLLYFYRIRATVLVDLLQRFAYDILPDWLSGFFDSAASGFTDLFGSAADGFVFTEPADTFPIFTSGGPF